MNAYLVTHVSRSGAAKATAVAARTPQAAVRKVYGRNTSFGAERVTAAGALRALGFSTAHGHGEVQWAIQPGVALVKYAYRDDADPFWTDPAKWRDSETHPLALVAVA